MAVEPAEALSSRWPRALAAIGARGWLLTPLLCLAFGYLLAWERGFHLDDYAQQARAIDVQSGEWRPIWSPVRQNLYPQRILDRVLVMQLNGLVLSAEPAVRGLQALAVAINALLLGGLAYRLLGSRLAALVSGWLFLAPFFAWQALLTVFSSTYLVSAMLMLTFLHAFWGGLTRPWTAPLRVALGTLALAVMLWVNEAPIIAVWLTLAFVPILALQRARGALLPALLRRCLLMLVPPICLTGLMYLAVLRGGALVEARGGLETSVENLVRHAQAYFRTLGYLTVSDAGHLGTPLRNGLDTLAASPLGLVLSIAACLTLGLSVAVWRSETRTPRPPLALGLLVLTLGLTWFLATLLLPGILVTRQELSERMLYFPFGGLCLALGALAWIAARSLPRPWGERLLVGLAGIAMLVGSIGVLGYARGLAARFEMDRRELRLLMEALPSEALPRGSYLVLAEPTPRQAEARDRVAPRLVGVFDTDWSAEGGVWRAYRRGDLRIRVPSFQDTRFSFDNTPEANPREVRADGDRIPPDRAIVFWYEDDGVRLADALVLVDADGTRHRFELPLAREVSRRNGAAPRELVVPNQADR